MRLLGLVLALGAMVWVMMQVTGGSDAETVIPEGHQAALEKAENLEDSLHQTVNQKMRDLEQD